MSKDPSDPKAEQKRTRLNAELANQFGYPRRKRGENRVDATPGRGSLTGELEEPQVDGAEVEVEAELEDKDAVVPEVTAKKSLFELPRKEPSRQPLLTADNVTSPTAPAAPATPAPPPGTKPTGRRD